MFAFSIIPFIYMAFLQRKKIRDRNQIIVCQGLGLQLQGISGLDRTTLFLDFYVNYTTVYINQNSENYAEKVYFTICELYLIFFNNEEMWSLLRENKYLD